MKMKMEMEMKTTLRLKTEMEMEAEIKMGNETQSRMFGVYGPPQTRGLSLSRTQFIQPWRRRYIGPFTPKLSTYFIERTSGSFR